MVTMEDVQAASRATGAILRIGSWQLTRHDLLSRFADRTAWRTAGEDERAYLTDEAATLIAQDLNTHQPWNTTTPSPHPTRTVRTRHGRTVHHL